jgi:multidrug resistance efflux pump
MSRAGLTIALALVVVFLAACSDETPTAPAAAPPTVDVDTISVDTGFGWVSAEGTLVPLRDAPLSVSAPGQVTEISVAAGDEVVAGEALLRLDSADQEAALRQAQSMLSRAEANLESAQAELAAAQASQLLAELGVEAAEAQLAFVEAGPTAEQIAVAESSVGAAEAGISAAAGNQALVLEGAGAAQILAAESQLRLAQASEKQARDALNAASGEEKARLEEQLQAAVANVNAAQAALDELQRGASPSERLATGSAVSQAIAQRDSAQSQLELLLSGASEEALEIAQVDVQRAEAALERAGKGVAQAEVAVAQAEAGIVQAQATVEAAQTQLDRMTLSAPFPGTVAEVAYRPGEIASSGMPAIQLADLDGWLVETTDLSEQDVVALATGFPAEIRLDAFPGETFSGRVIKIAPAATVVAGDVRYVVTIELDDPGELPLRWGMTAVVDIEVD